MNNLPELKKLLEFDKVLSIIQTQTETRQTRERLAEMPFMTSMTDIADALAKVAELQHILQHDTPFPLSVWDIEAELKIAKLPGSAIASEGLANIVKVLNTAATVFRYLRTRRTTAPALWTIAEGLQILKELVREIISKIDPDTNGVRDSASPALSSIRKEIARLEQKARKQLEKVFGVYAGKGYLQETVITLKDGRLVFPVKAEHKGRVKGFMHDQSATGATLFIEPIESIELNNALRTLRERERQEIDRILRQLTALVHDNYPAITTNFELLLELDFILVKAHFAAKYQCNQPKLNDRNRLAIVQGRHPLLLVHKKTPSDVVPLDIETSPEIKTVVISGPNAGGKSVVLKTIGLFTLMVQSGLPVPADPDTSLPLFENVFADIGDLQSIENDLSTFTSHVASLDRILRLASDRSLILIDEIGASTDPDEGAALSMAILQELTERGCKTVVTTHHGHLKTFAYNTHGVENASLEFDIETLRPTYRFKMGLPGSSYALEISNRMGIPEQVLTTARRLLGSDKNKLENLILALDQQIQASRKLSHDLDLAKLRLEGLTNLYTKKTETFKQEQSRLKKEALRQAREILDDANKIIEKTIKEIREGQANRETIARAKAVIGQRTASVQRQIEDIEKHEQADEESIPALKPEIGKAAWWQAQKKRGTIVAIQSDTQKVLLQLDNMKIWVDEKELTAVPEATTGGRKTTIRIETSAKDDVLPEIDVRGCKLEEARSQVDKFLDDAILAGWNQVRVIHGKGTGALRKGLADYLSDHPLVASQKMGAWNEGDTGVTVVDLA